MSSKPASRNSLSGQRRPKAVSLLAFILLFSGLVSLLASLGVAGALSLFEVVGILGPGLLLFSVGVPLLLVFPVVVVSAVGIWKGARWSREFVLFASAVDAVISAFLLVAGSYAVIPALLVNLALLYYLSRDGPSAHFHRRSFGPAAPGWTGQGRLFAVPAVFLLTMSAFTPAIQVGVSGIVATDVAPAYTPGFRSVRAGRTILAYRIDGLIPELRLEPSLSVDYGGPSSLPKGQSKTVGGTAFPEGNAPSTAASPTSVSRSYPAPSQPAPSGAICNDTQYSGSIRFHVYNVNPGVNQPYGCIFDYVGIAGAMAYDPNNGYIFAVSDVSLSQTNGAWVPADNVSITVLSDLSGDVVADISLPPAAQSALFYSAGGDMVFDPSNNLLYAIGSPAGNVTEIINAATLSYQGSVWIGNGGLNYDTMALDSTGGLLYVTNGSTNSIVAIDTSTNTLVANITLPSPPMAAVYDSYSDRVFVDWASGFGTDNVSVIAPMTNKIVDNITLPNSLLWNLVYDSANHLVYAEDGDVSSPISLSVINGTSDQFVTNVPLTGSGPNSGDNLFFNPGNGEIYDPLNNGLYGNTTIVYDPATGSVQEIGVCDAPTFYGDDCGPIGVTYDSWNGVMYFSKSSGAIISVPTVAVKLPHQMVFTESGLPPRTGWNVTVGWSPQQGGNGPTRRSTNSSDGQTITFEIPGGNTYSYSLENITMPCSARHCSGDSPAGYEPSPSAGSFVLGSGGYQVGVNYAPLYTAYLEASSLPQNQRWSATLSECASVSVGGGIAGACSPGSRKSSNGGEIAFLVRGGAGYSFNVSSLGYVATPAKGSFTADQNEIVPVSFMLLTTGQGILTAFGDVFVVDPTDSSVKIYTQSPFLGIQGSVQVGSDPVALAAVTVGALSLVLAVNQGSDSVTVIDPSTGTAVDSISVGGTPVSIAVLQGQPVLPTGEAAVMVTDYGSDSLSVILFSPGTCTVACVLPNVNAQVTNVQLADSPVGIAATAATAYGWAYVSLYNSRAVEIFRVTSYNSVVDVTGTGYLATGLNPMGVAIDQRDDVMVANAGSGGASEILPACSSCTPISPPDSNSQVLPVALGATGSDASAFVGVASDETNTTFFMSGSDARGHDQLSVVNTGIYTGSYLGDYNLENPWAEIPGLTAPFQTNAVGVLNTTAALVAPTNGSLYVVPTFPLTFEVCGNIAVKSTSCISGFPAEMSINNATYAPPTAFPLTVYLPGGPNLAIKRSCTQNCYFFYTDSGYSYDFAFTAPSGYLVNGTTFSPGLDCATYSPDYTVGVDGPCNQFNYMFASNYKPTPNSLQPVLAIVGINGPATVMMNVSQIQTPNSWLSSPYFQVSENVVSFKDIASAAGALLGSLVGGPVGGGAGGAIGYLAASNSPRLEVDSYTIKQTPGSSFAAFNDSLHYYFNVTYPAGYGVSSVTVTHIPLIRILNHLLPISFPENDSGTPYSLLGMALTPGGSVNLVSFTSTPAQGLGSCTSTDATCAWVTSAGGLGLALLALVLCVAKPDTCSTAGIFEGAGGETLDISKMILSVLAAIGSTWADVESSSMIGAIYQKVSTEKVFDFMSATALVKFISAVVSAVVAYLKVGNDIGEIIKENYEYVVNLIVDVFATITQTINAYCAVESCSSDLKGFISAANDVESAVSLVMSFVEHDDPNGSTVYPSYYYENGTLALGYDSATGQIMTRSRSGFLLASSDGFYAFLNAGYNYSLVLTMVGPPGTNTTIPYTTWESGGVQTSAVVSGQLANDSQTAIPIEVTKNGAFVSPAYLEPKVSVSGTPGSYTVNARSALNNGSSIAASGAYITVNGSTYPMRQVNSTSFSYQVSGNFQGPTLVTVEVLGYGMPGGFGAAYLTPNLAPGGTTTTTSSQPSHSNNGASGQGFPIIYALAGLAAAVVVAVALYMVKKRRPAQALPMLSGGWSHHPATANGAEAAGRVKIG
ncbi:MAG: hypothetical protein JRM80_00670 [Nitrososphaerota archaeon]|nr:hypothetical protein [Nitrososphaerota archaeon]